MNALVLAVGLAAIACIDAVGASSAMPGDRSPFHRADMPKDQHLAADEKVDPRIAMYDLGHACSDAGGALVREAGADGSVSYRCYVAAAH